MLRLNMRHLQQLFGRGTQVPVPAIDHVEAIAVGAGHDLERADDHLSPDLQLARIGLRKDGAGEILDRETGVERIQRAQILRHGGALGQFAALGGQRLAQRRKLQPRSVPCSHPTGPLFLTAFVARKRATIESRHPMRQTDVFSRNVSRAIRTSGETHY